MKYNLYFQLIKRILIVFLLFTLCRFVFYLYNLDLYHDRTWSQLLTIFTGGLRFDATAIFFINLVYLVMFLIPFKFRYNTTYQTVGKYIYWITNGFALLINCMDTVYFRNTFRRTTLSVFREFSNDEKIGAVFVDAFIQNWYLAVFLIAAIALMVWRYGKPLDKSSILICTPWKYYATGALGMFVCLTVMVIGIRGGVTTDRPLNINHSGKYATAAIDVPLILNTPFAVIKSVDKQEIKPLVYFTDSAELDFIYTPVYQSNKDSIEWGGREAGFKDMNVMIIILESFSREYFGFYNQELANGDYKGYTPFLDTLISKHSFTHIYSYGNGRKSIDATVSVLASIPAIPEPFVLSGYLGNTVRSLPMLLREKGYETAFFCGSPKGSMGFAQTSNILGIEHYFGMESYGNDVDYDGVWGIWDDEFFQFTARKISQLRQPFLATLFTVSSHAPFKIPKHRENDFECDIPIHCSIRYTDEALKHFFETAAKESWFANTLFVITGDHVNVILHDEYRTSAELFAIPVVFYKPDGSLKKTANRVAQQIDIMPTVLGYLGYDKPFLAFGFDLNNETIEKFAFNYFNGTYQLITDQYLLIFDGQKSVGLYDLRNDKFLTENLIDIHTEIGKNLETKAKAFLQQYTTRMVENRLVP